MPTSRTSPVRRAVRMLRPMSLGGAVVAVCAASLAPAAAHAAELTPAVPTGVRVAATTAGSLTITSSPSANATRYRVFVSTTRSKLAVATIASNKVSPTATAPRVTVSGLTYTTAPYYYRLQAINASKVRYSDIYQTNLRPDGPSNVRVSGRRSTGLALAWDGRAAGRYVITQATSSTFTTGVRTYSVTSQAHSFTPYGLTLGNRYWFRVRGYNGSVASTQSAAVSAVAPSSGQTVRVMSYNLLHSSRDGEQVGTETIAPWSQRRVAAAALVRQADPDVLGVQEASDWVDAPLGPKMVDDLAARVGGYTVAHTEVTPGQPGWFRTARYLLYRTSAYRAVGDGGYWTLAPSRWAVYQLLENRTTGARFLAVCVHLEAGAGEAADLRRAAQTRALLAAVKSFQATNDVPVVYVGDFNSHERNVVDGPGNTFRAAAHADADEVAQTLVNTKYNSANQYLRTPPASGLAIDHVYAPPGVAVRRFEVVLNLTAGRFVGVIPSDHNPVVADVVLPY